MTNLNTQTSNSITSLSTMAKTGSVSPRYNSAISEQLFRQILHSQRNAIISEQPLVAVPNASWGFRGGLQRIFGLLATR